MIEYLPFEQRVPDTQYEDLLRAIMKNGKDKRPIHADQKENKDKGTCLARELTGKACCLEYNLENGFPAFTCRNLKKVIPGAIGEISGFLNGARTFNELKSFGCPDVFWGPWVTKDKCDVFGLKEGDLGDGSYGPALRAFPTPRPYLRKDWKEELTQSYSTLEFDQLAALNEEMGKKPMSRTLLLTTWIPHLAIGSPEQGFPRKVVVAPCHGTLFHVHIFPELGEMEVTCVQRSADVPVGLQFNVSQWCTLGLVLSMIHGLKFTKYTHFISSAQIYHNQFESVEILLGREPRKFPTVTLEPEEPYKLPWELRKEHFKFGEDYAPHPWLAVPTLI